MPPLLPLQWVPASGLETGWPVEPVLGLVVGVAALAVAVWWVLEKSTASARVDR